MDKTKTYGEETNDDIIAELKDLLKQEQILINRLEFKLKEKNKTKRAKTKTEQITPRPEPHQVRVLDEEIPSEKDEDERTPF